MVDKKTNQYTLYSGGAIGTDALFGENAERYGITERHFSFAGHKKCRSQGRVILNDIQLKEGNNDLINIIGVAFKNHQGTGDNTEKYWQRNWYQVQKAIEIFAVVKEITSFFDFTKTQTKMEGAGIPIAVAMKTKENCKRVYVYDQTLAEWYVWKRHVDHAGMIITYKRQDANTLQIIQEKLYFENINEELVKIMETDFTGIGTREINGNGIEAINNLFKRSFQI